MTGPHVAILLATFDGAAFLAAQLESIAAQKHGNWSLIVSDDGSRDRTLEILGDFASAGHRVAILPGPGRGAAANFMSLLQRATDHVPPGSFLAFADQDDVWLPDRLSHGLAALAGNLRPGPAAWCSRTLVTGAALEHPRLSAPRPRPLSFRNALVQNVMAGNTILLNPQAGEMAATLARQTPEVVYHDWWLYLILTGCGAEICHDDRPSLLYRQHGGNSFGTNTGLLARAARLWGLMAGQLRLWLGINLAVLHQARPWLTAENAALADLLAQARQSPLGTRLRLLGRLGLYRQSRTETVALWMAAIFGRL